MTRFLSVSLVVGVMVKLLGYGERRVAEYQPAERDSECHGGAGGEVQRPRPSLHELSDRAGMGRIFRSFGLRADPRRVKCRAPAAPPLALYAPPLLRESVPLLRL